MASNIKVVDISLPSLLDSTNDWDIIAHLLGRREYPVFIRKTRIHPDVVVYSAAQKDLMIELMVPRI